MIIALMSFKLTSCSLVHFHSQPDDVSVNLRSDALTFDNLGRNFPRYCTSPRKVSSSCRFLGFCTIKIALTFSRSGFTPFWMSTCPTYFTSVFLTLHFSLLSFRLYSFERCKTLQSLWSCSSIVEPLLRISSMITSASVKSSHICDIIF